MKREQKQRKEVKTRMKAVVCLMLAGLISLTVAPAVMALGTPAGTVISNQAYADYQDANGNARPRVYSNTVTTTVSQVACVDVQPPTAAQNGIPGTSVSYAAQIHNLGNGTDTFSLTAVNDQGWTTTIYKDDNGNGILDAGETTVLTSTGALNADSYLSVIVVTEVPTGASMDATSVVTLTATSQFDGTKSDFGQYTTTVQAAAMQMTKAVYYDRPGGPIPGDVITYAITGKNLGTTAALNITAVDNIPANTTYVPGSIRLGPIGGTYATAVPQTDAADSDSCLYNSGAKRVELTWGTLEPFNLGGAGGVLYFQVQVNSGVTQGAEISNSLTAHYNLTPGGPTYTATTNTASATVGYYTAILLDPDRSGSYNPGDQVVYSFTATNNGNAADRINLVYNSTSAWSWVFWADVDANGIPGTNGDYLLTDTNGDGKIDTGILTPNGGSIRILAVATVPAGSSDGAVDVTTVTGSSARDASVTDPEILTTTVTAPVLSVTKTVTPTGSQPPGTVLTYTITVTNTGSGAATNVVISDIIPQYTSYQAGSIKTGATVATLTPRTDASDGDGGRYDATSRAVIAGSGAAINLGPGGTWVVQFQVKID